MGRVRIFTGLGRMVEREGMLAIVVGMSLDTLSFRKPVSEPDMLGTMGRGRIRRHAIGTVYDYSS